MTLYESVLEQARALSPDERERLVAELSEALTWVPGVDEAEWESEVAHRVREARLDPWATVSADEAQRLIFGD